MRTKTAIAPLVAMFFTFLFWSAALTAASAPGNRETLARAALRGTPEEASEAVVGLRREGPAGMEALLALAGSCLDGSCRDAAETIDRVCGVRDCADIRLFWYTDLEAAKETARATGKPILSLRLMGRLDEELSCANSRFFSTVYYKNREVNELLRERFVLHWRSVRPVPRVTIDFGDGTRLERTLTGNSIHYVLDSRGRLVEALPGLSGPEAFRNALDVAARAARTAAGMEDAQLVNWLTARHRRQLAVRSSAWFRDLAALAPRPALNAAPAPALATASKMAGEQPLLMVFDRVSDDQLREIARLRRPSVHLDPASRAFLLRKHGVTDAREAERLVDSFEETIALDEVINEYRTGPAILEKLSDPEDRKGLELETFNQWVYEGVFQTPLSDPWLGLAPPDVYVALPASTRTAAARPDR